MDSTGNDMELIEIPVDTQQPSAELEEDIEPISDTDNATTNVANIDDSVKASASTWNLKCDRWTVPSSIISVVVFFLFTCVVMTIGILIVCFTSPKQKAQTCEMNFSPTLTNPIEYNYGPQSVAVGYFNNDTWIDMVIANSIVNNIAIYFGYGNTTFSKQIEYSTGLYSTPSMVAIGDLNNDARFDIAVANFGTNNIGMFIGFGNGSFKSQIELSTQSSRPVSITLVDFNNDTLIDIATVNYGTNSISIFYGYGNGAFSIPITYSTGYDSLPAALVTGYFNNDNYLDIVVA
ncbi:unnamed protein product, partial [Adineta steineri]